MRLKLLVLLCSVGAVSASPSFSQEKKIDVSYDKVSLISVFNDLKAKTGYQFFYYKDDIPASARVSMYEKEATLEEVLDKALESHGLSYAMREKLIIITPSNTRETQQPQQQAVTGRVTDENSQPITGVSVMLQGTQTGTATDVNGRYSIMVPAGGVLNFSHIGFMPQTIEVGAKSTINVVMEVRKHTVGNVIVTGYRLIDEESATGSYTTVGEDILDRKPVTNISHALTGMVTGLAKVTSTIDGQDRFLIRGEGTLQSSQIEMDPLIVVDGFPIQGFTPTNVGGDGILNAKDPFATINPNDVESITVLKDAAATSIYGARAANGVIVITTKKGKAGDKVNISVNGFVSVSSKPDLDYAFSMASAESQFFYIENLKKYSSEYAGFSPYTNTAHLFNYYSDAARLVYETFDLGNMSESDYNAQKAALIAQAQDKKWIDDLNKLVYRNAITQQYNIALRGGTPVHTYSFSAGYEREDTYQRGNQTQKVMANFMNSFQLHRKVSLDVGLNANLSNSKNNAVTNATLKSSLSPWSRLVDDNGDYVYFNAASITYPYASANTTSASNSFSSSTAGLLYNPILESKYADKMPVSWRYNPVEDAGHMNNTSERLNARLNMGLTYKVIDGLTAAVRAQYERTQYEQRMVYGPESYYVRNYVNTYSILNASTGKYDSYFPTGGVLNNRGDKYEGYTFRGQLDYNKEFGKHRIAAIAGTEVISSTNQLDPTIWRYGYNENTNAVLTSVDYVNQKANFYGANVYLPYISPGTIVTLEDRFFSVYADAEYMYNNRYILTGSFRTDASNYQAESARDKFSPFWSVGGAWILSREEFMNDARNWVDHLKLRVSIGESGLAAGKYGTSTVTTLGTYAGSIYHTNNEAYNRVSARGNSTLTWEKSRTFDVGLEFRLWDNKLYGSVEYYNKFSYDVLSSATVPIITQGVTSATYNNAEISNKGVELSLGTRMTIAGDLRWNGMLNLSYNKNVIEKYLVAGTVRIGSIGYMEGYARGSVWVYNPVGYTPEGYIILRGRDGTEEIVKDRATTHYYDDIPRKGEESIEDYNWAYHLGTTSPTTNLSFSSTFTYKGITLSFLITGKFDYYFARNDMFSTSHSGASFPKVLDKSVQTYNEGYANQTSYSYFPLYSDDNTGIFSTGFTWPYMSNLHNASRAAYLKGDHIRLNEVYLGYELPAVLLDQQKLFRSVDVFFQARNLGLIWSANKVMDPDYKVGNFKPTPTYTFGLKFNFN